MSVNVLSISSAIALYFSRSLTKLSERHTQLVVSTEEISAVTVGENWHVQHTLNLLTKSLDESKTDLLTVTISRLGVIYHPNFANESVCQ